jgi:hypothetical protein
MTAAAAVAAVAARAVVLVAEFLVPTRLLGNVRVAEEIVEPTSSLRG